MSEIGKIVVEHFPVEKLPDELRQGLARGQLVRVTVEQEQQVAEPGKLADLLGVGKGVYGSPEEAIAAIRELRND